MTASDIQTDNNRRHHGSNELEIMDQILRRIGSINNYEDFVASVIDELKRQTSCDQVVSIFSDAGGHIYDCKLQGVSSGWGTAYQKYYSKIQGEFDFGYDKGRSNMEKFLPIRQIRWQDFEPNEFIRDCVIMRGVKYSIELPFLDPLGTARWALALDRTRKDPYSEDELALVNRIYPHLCNLHQKFFLNEFSSRNTMSRKDAVMELMNLTAREKEIVNLLCDGMSPEEISQLLKITKSTTNRHIANIFGKMGVDRLQTLLVRLLGA